MHLLSAKWLWTGHQLVEDAGLLVSAEGTVAAVGTLAEVEAAAAGASDETPLAREDLGETLLLPGLVNAHSHAFQRTFRGRVQWRQAGRDDSFWTWRQAMYSAANDLDPDAFEAVSRRCFTEMVRSGVTHVGEFHYVHHDRAGQPYSDPDELARRVIRAARDVGLRVTLLRVAYGASGLSRAPGGVPLLPEQRRFATRSPDEALAAVARLRALDDPLVSVGLAPHSVRAVPRAWLPELAAFDGPIHVHVAEQPAEVAACKATWGCGPLALLAEAGLVDARFTAVHLTFPEPEDPALLRRAGAGVCACPTTEMDLGDGFLPLALRDGVPLSLGSDSHARIDLLGEARALEWHARALAGRRNVMTPPGDGAQPRHALAGRLVNAATLAGSVALGGRGDGLRAGAPADLCALDLDRPAAEGVPPLEAAVFSGSPEWVSAVWVQGRRVWTRP